jgi:hypothetical protein
MKASSQQELCTYLSESISAIQGIKNLAMARNKTTKVKAILSMLSIVENRMDAGLKYAKAGGLSGLDVTMQQQMYNPIVEWLVDELSK